MQVEKIVPNTFKLILPGVLVLGGALPVTVLPWDIQVAGLPQLQLNGICSSSSHHLLGLLT